MELRSLHKKDRTSNITAHVAATEMQGIAGAFWRETKCRREMWLEGLQREMKRAKRTSLAEGPPTLLDAYR